MNKPYQSFSKRLSQRILVIFLATISVITVLIVLLTVKGQVLMTDAFLESELDAANETIGKMHQEGATSDQLYERMKMADVKTNKKYPIVLDGIKQERGRGVWIYSIVIDSLGQYIYHPDKQRIGKGNFYDDIRQTTDDQKQELIDGLTNGRYAHQLATVDGEKAHIYFASIKGTNWRNALIVPREGQLGPTIHIALIILGIIALGMLVAYWVSRRTIHCSTQPLQLLANSADQVAMGNLQALLPELKYNDELTQLRDSFGNMQESLTLYIDQLKTTTAQKAAIENELNVAREIQMSMVPTVFPQRDDIDIFASMTPAKAVGGDLFDFFIRDHLLFFCIGDVSGKGVPAALFMTEAKSLFRAYSTDESRPDRIVTQMNLNLSENNDSFMFVTFFVGILDLSTGELNYCNAGHEAPIIIGQDVHLMPVNHVFPVGLGAATSYQTQTVTIEPKTSILLYTDGLIEAMDAEQNLLGEERVLNELKQAVETQQVDPKAVIDRMIQTVRQFVGDTEQSDDLTLMVIRLKEKV